MRWLLSLKESPKLFFLLEMENEIGGGEEEKMEKRELVSKLKDSSPEGLKEREKKLGTGKK